MTTKNLRHAFCFDLLEEHIRKHAAGKTVIYVANNGNWGDGLIHTGTLQFFAHRNIAVQQVPRQRMVTVANSLEPIGYRMQDCLVIIGGSGAWCHHIRDARSLAAKLAGIVGHVIVLPTTYELPAVEEPGNRITYFSRDQFGSMTVNPASMFCHDMAFYLEVDPGPLRPHSAEGHFFRVDRERHPHARPFGDGFDISSIGGDSKDILPFFKILAGYGKIHTDRLHAGIAASMLEIETDIYPVNYAKTNDIFRSSVQPHYPSARLMSWPEP